MQCYLADLDTRYWEDVEDVSDDDCLASPSPISPSIESQNPLIIPLETPPEISTGGVIEASMSASLDEYLPEGVDWAVLGDELEEILTPVTSTTTVSVDTTATKANITDAVPVVSAVVTDSLTGSSNVSMVCCYVIVPMVVD